MAPFKQILARRYTVLSLVMVGAFMLLVARGPQQEALGLLSSQQPVQDQIRFRPLHTEKSRRPLDKKHSQLQKLLQKLGEGIQTNKNVVEKNIEECSRDSHKQIVLLTYARSGSTLTSDIISNHDDVFYVFEPLHDLAKHHTEEQNLYMKEHGRYLPLTSIPGYNAQATDMLTNYFSCDFLRLTRVAYGQKHIMDSPSTKDLYYCIREVKSSGGVKRCLSQTQEECNDKPTQFVKTIRFGVKTMGPLLDKFHCMKLIFLVRDPRGSMNSKKKTFAITARYNNITSAIEKFCKKASSDVEAIQHLSAKYPGRVFIPRYEDIALDPLASSRKIYKFLDMPFSERIKEFVINSTMSGTSDPDPYGTKRGNSSAVAFAWRHKLPLHEATRLDDLCAPFNQAFGYVPVTSEKELRDPKFSLVMNRYMYSNVVDAL